MSAFWAAELIGTDQDTSEMQRALNANFDPRVEAVDGTRALRCSLLDSCSSAKEVRDKAIVLIKVLNGASTLSRRSGPVRVGRIYRVGDDGSIASTVFAEGAANIGNVTLSATATITDTHGEFISPPPPAPSTAQRWFHAALDDPKIADLLTFVGQADNWFDVYKAMEMLRFVACSEHDLLTELGSRAPDFKNARWTANWHRHARATRPQSPASLDEARTLLYWAVETILSHRV